MPVEKKSNTRGCLHKLVVQNFKSYAGSLTLGPFKDFTCVIGPNGSGKSNLMDAVSFVVGVNTFQLRGSKLSDFRSNLTTATSDATSVTMYYHAPRNAGDKTPTETIFTRTITSRDANEWRVDGRKVDAEEYQKRLKAIGLLVKPRNFLVFQNEVEAVASKSPKQLTDLLERICGSEDLKAEYDDLQEKKNEASQASVAVYRRSVLVGNEKKILKEQVKEATSYQEKQDTLLQTKVKRSLFELFHIEKQLSKFADEVDTHAARQNECNENCDVINKGLAKKNRQKAEKEKEWKELDKKVQDLEKVINRVESKEVLKIDQYLEVKKQSVPQLEQEIKTLQEKAQLDKKNIKACEKLVSELQEFIDEEKSKNENREYELSSAQVSEFNRLKQLAVAKTQKLQADCDRIQRGKTVDDMTKKKIEGELSEHKSRESALVEILRQQLQDQSKAKIEMSECSDKEHKIKSELQDLEKSISDWTVQIKVLKEKNQEYTTQLSDARVDERQARSEEEKRRIVEYMCQSFPGVRGRVSDLCKVKQRTHELAITVIMEGSMDSIVVEREETAKKCIEYLREQRQKPMTFLPLDALKFSPPDERLRLVPGAKLAIDLIDFDKSNEHVMWHVTGNTLVVNSLDEAKRLAFSSSSPKCKIVTLNAEVISKTGAMTGGDTSHLTNKAQRWQQKAFDSLKEKAENNFKEKNSLCSKVEQANKRKTILDREKTSISHQLESLKKRNVEIERAIISYTKDRDGVSSLVKEKEKIYGQVQLRIDEKDHQLQKEKEGLNVIYDDVFKDFCAKLKIKHFSEFEGGSLKDHRDRNDRITQMEAQRSRHKLAINKLQDQVKYAEDQEKSKKEQVQKVKKEISDHCDEKVTKEEEIRKIKESKSSHEYSRKKIKEIIDEFDKELKVVQSTLKKAQNDLDEASRLVERAESKMESLRSSRKNIVEQCGMDEIPLPKKGAGKGQDGGDDPNDDEMQAEDRRCSFSQSAIQTKLEIAKDHYDYSRLPRDLKKELSDKEQAKIRNGFDDEQTKLLETLTSMNPNMKAMDQLKEVETKHTAVLEELRISRENSNNLCKKFDDVKQKRCELFNGCFDHVKDCIDLIYKELTSDPSKLEQSVGGSAYLTLNNQDEPYLDGIKYDTIPPGKRFMDMAHLSGGEKTVAALALLFSINSFSPAPFIVLDEVDAALDARNVAKVTRYIQARRKDQQCVIISLKERFYDKADALVGICRDISGGHSRVFTLDLSAYES